MMISRLLPCSSVVTSFLKHPCHLITTVNSSPFAKFCPFTPHFLLQRFSFYLFPLSFLSLLLDPLPPSPSSSLCNAGDWLIRVNKLRLPVCQNHLSRCLAKTTEHQPDNYKLCFKAARLHAEETITDCCFEEAGC